MYTDGLKIVPATLASQGRGKVFAGLTVLLASLAVFFLLIPAFAQEDEEQEASLRVAQLSPDASRVDVYVDDEPVEDYAGIPFKSVSSYLPFPAGERNVKVYPAGDSSEPLLEADVDLEEEASYALGIVGSSEDGSLAAKLYEDDLSAPSAGEAKLRVVHAVPDVGAANVGVKGDGDLLALPGFSDASNYAEVPAGTYTLEVRAAGTDEAALSIPDVSLSPGEVYTAFAVGRVADGSLDAVLTADSEGGGTGEWNEGTTGDTPREDTTTATTIVNLAPKLSGFVSGLLSAPARETASSTGSPTAPVGVASPSGGSAAGRPGANTTPIPRESRSPVQEPPFLPTLPAAPAQIGRGTERNVQTPPVASDPPAPQPPPDTAQQSLPNPTRQALPSAPPPPVTEPPSPVYEPAPTDPGAAGSELTPEALQGVTPEALQGVDSVAQDALPTTTVPEDTLSTTVPEEISGAERAVRDVPSDIGRVARGVPSDIGNAVEKAPSLDRPLQVDGAGGVTSDGPTGGVRRSLSPGGGGDLSRPDRAVRDRTGGGAPKAPVPGGRDAKPENNDLPKLPGLR